MTLPSFATLDELDARMPSGLSVDDEDRATAALEDASAMVRSVAGKTWVTDGELDADIPHVVKLVTIAVTRRILANPEGITSESIGSYSYSLANASADVYLTRQEKAAVRSAAGKTGVWTLATTAIRYDETEWIDVGQTEPMAFTYAPLEP